jgi:hypothetical protein
MTAIVVLLFLLLAWHVISGYRAKLGNRTFNVIAMIICIIALACLANTFKIGEFVRYYIR